MEKPRDENSAPSPGRNAKTSKLWTPGGEKPASEASADDKDKKPDEEEIRKQIEEMMEKITVADIALDMMISLSSLAYKRIGLPHEVNEKFKDMDQARLAIDCLDALVKTLEGRVPEKNLNPLKDTLSNLKLNFAKES